MRPWTGRKTFMKNLSASVRKHRLWPVVGKEPARLWPDKPHCQRALSLRDMGAVTVTLLDRYIFKSVLFTCAGAVGLLSFCLFWSMP